MTRFENLRDECRWEVPYRGLAGYLSFTDKESYLEWVRQWKDTYKSLTTEIRELKAQIRQAQRESAQNATARLHDTQYHANLAPIWELQRRRQTARHYATALLEIRRLGKALSWKLKQEQMATV